MKHTSPNLARIQAGIQLNKNSQNLAKILVILLYLSLKLSLKSAKMQRNHPNFRILNRKSGPSPIWLRTLKNNYFLYFQFCLQTKLLLSQISLNFLPCIGWCGLILMHRLGFGLLQDIHVLILERGTLRMYWGKSIWMRNILIYPLSHHIEMLTISPYGSSSSCGAFKEVVFSRFLYNLS